jgi:hypothetical protein
MPYIELLLDAKECKKKPNISVAYNLGNFHETFHCPLLSQQLF